VPLFAQPHRSDLWGFVSANNPVLARSPTPQDMWGFSGHIFYCRQRVYIMNTYFGVIIKAMIDYVLMTNLFMIPISLLNVLFVITYINIFSNKKSLQSVMYNIGIIFIAFLFLQYAKKRWA